MSPSESNAIRELIESRLDTTARQLDRIESQVRATNGRVTKIELREAETKAAAEEHRRMVAERQRADDSRNRKMEKWTGVVPTVLASVISGVSVALILLLVAGAF